MVMVVRRLYFAKEYAGHFLLASALSIYLQFNLIKYAYSRNTYRQTLYQQAVTRLINLN